MLYNIDLATAKEPKHWHFCDRCPHGISIGQEMEDIQKFLSEVEIIEPGYELVSWECVECGSTALFLELSEPDRQFLHSMNIKSIPWQRITLPPN